MRPADLNMYRLEQLASKPLFPTASKSTCDINNTPPPSPAKMHALYCLGDGDDDIVAILGCPSGVSYKCISLLTEKGTSKAQRHRRPSRIDENKERDHSRDTHSNNLHIPHTAFHIHMHTYCCSSRTRDTRTRPTSPSSQASTPF
jgi:hypothetical protein